MQIAPLLLALAGCSTGWNCDPDEEDFDVDEELTTADLDRIVADWGLESWDEVDCDTACRYAYAESRGWEMDSTTSCTLDLPVDEDNPGSVSCTGHGFEYFCEGRRPVAHVEEAAETPLAAMAHLEAASVDAFVELAAALEDAGADPSLVERCLAAAEDERNHASWLGRLAGVDPEGCTDKSNDLRALAIQNATEGCVHETFAALVGLERARRITDPRLKPIFLRIAQDELRHAQLAWDLHHWFSQRFDVEEVQAEALAALPARARSQALAIGEDPERYSALAGGLVAAIA